MQLSWVKFSPPLSLCSRVGSVHHLFGLQYKATVLGFATEPRRRRRKAHVRSPIDCLALLFSLVNAGCCCCGRCLCCSLSLDRCCSLMQAMEVLGRSGQGFLQREGVLIRFCPQVATARSPLFCPGASSTRCSQEGLPLHGRLPP